MFEPVSELDPRKPEHWLPRELFAAYCGARSDQLLAYYDKARAKGKPIVLSFDWLAVLVLPAWLGYRRQWASWASLVGTILVVSVGAQLAHLELPAGAFGGGLLALGASAHGLLLTTANGKYVKLKRQGLSDEAIGAALANKACPSAALGVAALLAAIAIQVAAMLLVPG